MADYQEYRIQIFPNINDEPISPTSERAGNGSHLINSYNGALEAIGGDVNNVNERVNTIQYNLNNLDNRMDDLQTNSSDSSNQLRQSQLFNIIFSWGMGK